MDRSIRKFEFTEILGWSHSRYDTFRTCKRKYYYERYAKYDIENILRINALSRLTSIPLEIGNITHELAKKLLQRLQKSQTEIDRGKFRDFSRRIAESMFRSRNFSEIYFETVSEIDFESEIFAPVMESLENLLESERFHWIMSEALTTADDWIVDPEGFGECRIAGLKAFCKVDVAIPLEGKIHLIDWKTGKEEFSKHLSQLKGYACWANFHFEKDFSEIVAAASYLRPAYSENEAVLNEYDIEDFSEQVRNQTEAMYEYCAEPELNFPLEKEEFAMTENRKLCGYCNFRELCGRS